MKDSTYITKHGRCNILCNYFNGEICKWTNHQVQINENIKGNVRAKRRAMDPSFALRRKYKQNGKRKQNDLNDKGGDESATNKVKLIGSKFSPLKRKYFYGGNRHNINRTFNKKNNQ